MSNISQVIFCQETMERRSFTPTSVTGARSGDGGIVSGSPHNPLTRAER